MNPFLPSPSSAHYALIFRLLLKITVCWAHNGDYTKFLEDRKVFNLFILNKHKKLFIYSKYVLSSLNDSSLQVF